MKIALARWVMLSGLLLFLSCEKSGLEDLPAEEAEFYLNGLIQQQDFSYRAGFSDYYQYTNLRASNTGVIHEGYLQPRCEEDFCGPGIMVAIHNTEEESLRNLLADDPDYFFDKNSIPGRELFEIELWSMDSIYQPDDYTWMIDNETAHGTRYRDTVNGSNHIFCLTVEEYCASQICRTVNLSEGYFCQTSLDFYPTGSNNYEVAAQASGSGPFTYVWNNGIVGEDIIMYEQDGHQYLCATMMDAENCTAVHCSEVAFEAGEIDYCDNDFGFNFRKVGDQSSIHGKVEVVYTDGNGTSYYSRYVEQQSGIFQPSNVRLYRPNAEGDPTLMFDVQLNCRLMSENGDIIEINDVTGVFALAGE